MLEVKERKGRGYVLTVFDPGETTGWAMFEKGECICGAFPNWQGVDDILINSNPSEILVEEFRLYGFKAHMMINSTFIPCEVIGVIKYLAEFYQIPVTTAPASLRNSVKQLIYREDFTSPHARDAVKHGLAYLGRRGRLTPEYRALIKRNDTIS